MAINPTTSFTKTSLPTTADAATDTLCKVNGDRQVLSIQASPANSGTVYVTLDGSAPSSTNWHLHLSAGTGVVHSVPTGKQVRAIGSEAGQAVGGYEG